MAIEITTPVGRIVWGHPTKSRTKMDQQTKSPKLKADGSQIQQWSFGVAFPKAIFEHSIWPALAQEAATGFPQGVPPKFSWKFTDGDGVDSAGQPFHLREGYAGCIILAVSSELMAPPVFKLVNGAYQQLAPDAIKCGDYVSVGLNIKVNVPSDRAMTPGLYINPMAVEFVGYGTEIVSQGNVDPAALFKGQQHQLPPGASATPMAPAGAPGMPGMGQGAQAPGYPPPAAPGYAAPPMAPAPAPGYPGAPAPGYPPQPGYPAPGQPGMMPGR